MKLNARHYFMFGAIVFFLLLAILGIITACGLFVVYKAFPVKFLGGVVLLASLAMIMMIVHVLQHEIRKLMFVKTIEICHDDTVCIILRSGIMHRYASQGAVKIMHDISNETYALELKGPPNFYIHQLDVDDPSAFSNSLKAIAELPKPSEPQSTVNVCDLCPGKQEDNTFSVRRPSNNSFFTERRKTSYVAKHYLVGFRIILTVMVFAGPGVAVGVYEICHRLFHTGVHWVPYFVGGGFSVPIAFMLCLLLRSRSSQQKRDLDGK